MGDIAQRGNKLTQKRNKASKEMFKLAQGKRIRKFGGGRTNLLEELQVVELENIKKLIDHRSRRKASGKIFLENVKNLKKVANHGALDLNQELLNIFNCIHKLRRENVKLLVAFYTL